MSDYGSDLFAPRKLTPTEIDTARVAVRRVFLLQGMSKVLERDETARQGQWYVGGDPKAPEGTAEAEGYAAKELPVVFLDRKYTRRFDKNNELICASDDAKHGSPTDKGKVAPYNIPAGQACSGCQWLKKATATDPDKNGFCSLVRTFETAVPDRSNNLVQAELSLRNTAGPAADEIISKMKDATADDGSYTPIKLVLGSKKPDKKAYYVPVIKED